MTQLPTAVITPLRRIQTGGCGHLNVTAALAHVSPTRYQQRNELMSS